MQRRTTHSANAAASPGVAAPRAAPAPRQATQANTIGTRRLAQRGASEREDFYRPFPRKLLVSALGAGSYLGDCTDDEDERYHVALREAISLGVNIIDTASNYRCQRSERVVGQVVAEAIAAGAVRRDELLVCTKGGYVALDGEPPATREGYDAWLHEHLFAPGIVSPENLARGGHSLHRNFIGHQLDQSRRNLGLATIDLYYLHNPEEQLLSLDRAAFRVLIQEAFAVLEERALAGEIVGYGCATWLGLRMGPDHRQHLSLADLMAIARDVGGTTHHFRAVQLPVSLAMPEAARVPTQQLGRKLVPLLEAADALGLGVVASAPLMQGRLTSRLPEEMHALFPTCTTDAQRALRFASALPGMGTVLAGMRHVEHVRENVAAWNAVMLA
jgi:aryl-alcohol dehydrogenase-like predicted oxidoreductase